MEGDIIKLAHSSERAYDLSSLALTIAEVSGGEAINKRGVYRILVNGRRIAKVYTSRRNPEEMRVHLLDERYRDRILRLVEARHPRDYVPGERV